MKPSYYVVKGGMPPQASVSKDPSIFTTAYAFISHLAQRDIVTMRLPHFIGERVWVLARPLTGFAETFSHYIVELSSKGGSDRPEAHNGVESALFVVSGQLSLQIDQENHQISAGHFVFIPSHLQWKIWNHQEGTANFHWIRKRYIEASPEIGKPDPIILRDPDVTPKVMAGSDGKWSTTRFIDPDDTRYDMHMTIVNFEPGGLIPFDETHVMEHGLYVLQGEADYRLNQDWKRVVAGDYMWLRAFCPQSCIARGEERFRYLLYKDMHRHFELTL